MKRLFILGACLLWAGCGTPRIEHVASQGQVVDARTEKPISNALVRYPGKSAPSTLTDSRGYFNLPETKFETWLPALGDYRPSSTLLISAPHYQDLESYWRPKGQPIPLKRK